MSSKDVKEIASKGLGGSLLCAIDKYYRNQKAIDNEKLIKDYEFQLKNKQNIIEGLRNEETDSRGYGEGRYQGD